MTTFESKRINILYIKSYDYSVGCESQHCTYTCKTHDSIISQIGEVFKHSHPL
jgi:hypothetical protein